MKVTGVIFGVFDGFHEGHRYFLSEALKIADSLVIALTVPETAMFLKKRLPRHSFDDRAKAIHAWNPDIKIVPGDTKLGQWTVLRDLESYIIILGYDQMGIASELEKTKKPFVFIGPHHPEKYKSSLI